MFKKLSNYSFILLIILFTVNQPSHSELSSLNSGEVWGVSRTKINSNLTDLEARKMNKSTYDANSDGKIDSTALPTNIPTTETVGQLVEDAVTDAVADIPGSTVVPDETDPTKAAAAVIADSADTATTAGSATTAGHATTADSATTAGSADSATYATTAGTAGTVAAVSGDAVTSGTVDDARIDSAIARDTEVSGAIEAAISAIELPEESTIVPDISDPTKAAAAVTADSATTAGSATVADSATTAGHATTADSATTATSADSATIATTATTAGSADYATSAGSSASVNPVKTSGVPGMMSVYESEGTSTLKTGFIGPANSSLNYVYQFPNGIPSPGDTFVMGTALTGQILPDGSTGTIIPLTHAAGGSSADDTAYDTAWNGDTTTAPSKNALYDKIETLSAGSAPTIQSADPTSASSAGFYCATTSGDSFYKTSTGLFNLTEGTYTPDPITPTVVSRVIGTDGVTFTETYSHSCSVGSGGSGGHALSDGKTFTYTSGLPGLSAVYTLSSAVLSGATVTGSYTQPGNGIEATTGGVDLASYATQSVTNNSTQTGANYDDILFYWGSENTYVADKPVGLTATTHTLSYHASPKLAGSYSATYTDSTYDQCKWTNTADAILDRTEGRVWGWINAGPSFVDDATYFEAYYDSVNYFRIRNYGTAGGIEVIWEGGGTYYTQLAVATALTADSPMFVEVAWNSSTGIKIYLNGVEQAPSVSGTFAAMSATPANGTVSIGGNSAFGSAPVGASYDQWGISNDSARDGYAIRTETNLE